MGADAEVRFIRNPAGERIAYAVHGQGSPLVCVAWWVSHLEADWEHPGYRRFFAQLGAQHTVVRYDRPGAGLSDRRRETVDLESEVATLEAIVDGLGLREMSLLGIACGGPTAVAYAARHPERVTKLVAFGSYVRGSDIGSRGARDAVQALVRESWGLGSKALADLFAPDLDAEERRVLGRAQRAAASADMASRLLALTFDVDVEPEAREVSIPALVVHRKDDRAIPFAAGCELAACLPGAGLRSLDGKAHPPWYGDVAAASRAVLEFLGTVEHAPARPPGPMAHELRREGVLWHFTFDGDQISLPTTRGLEDLSVLLAHPGEEIHATVLWNGGRTERATVPGADPVLDDAAMASYARRLAELQEALAEAEQRQLSDRADQLRGERDAIARELRAAVGLGKRKRRLDDASEKARKAVSGRIRFAIGKLAELHPLLGEHLERRVRTGTRCRYEPGDGPAWTVR